jgi:hypothetical protein
MTFLGILLTLFLIGSLFAFIFNGLFSSYSHPMTESQKKRKRYIGWYAILGLFVLLAFTFFNEDFYQ